jgi:pimeloyl-ACP methyl ester carboxylesterase
MQLEVLKHLPATRDPNKPPLIFVHGAFAGAWCWEEHFLPYFAAQGYPAYALSLRGHGRSGGILMSASLADYVADVAQVVASLTQVPILVGHSMGGMVVQKYLERAPVQAAILMNSVPPFGLAYSWFYMGLTNPLLLQQLSLMQSISPLLATPAMLRQALFSPDIAPDKLKRYFRQMQGESIRVNWDLLGGNLPRFYPRPKTTMLVLGAENDAFFPRVTTKMIADHYHAQHHIFSDTAHAMMLENNWQTVADYIAHWLAE